MEVARLDALGDERDKYACVVIAELKTLDLPVKNKADETAGVLVRVRRLQRYIRHEMAEKRVLRVSIALWQQD